MSKGPDRESIPDRFARIGYTVTDAGCHEWNGGKYRAGYGAITVERRRMGYAHRISWELANGPIPPEMFVCHSCDNPPCVNPEHLFLGTVDDNNRDMKRKGRHARGETNGSARLTAADVADIRAARASGVSRTDLATRYGIHPNYIWSICQGEAWRHVS